MLVALRHNPLALALPALQAAGFAVALLSEERALSLWALAGVAGFALFGWWKALARGRLIADTPTSRVASAAQGYTELRGRGRALAGTPLHSPLFGLPVLWYRLRTERRRGDRWDVVDSHESEDSFLLDDGSGSCAIDPAGAEMLVTRKDVVTRTDERLTQWSLLANDPIYAIGEFRTLGSVSPDFDLNGQIKHLLAEWKQDRPSLLARFDSDRNGEIDLEEWARARAAARHEVENTQREVLLAPEAHLMQRPSEGRLYLISDLDPQQLCRRQHWIALAQGLLFLIAIGLAAAIALA